MLKPAGVLGSLACAALAAAMCGTAYSQSYPTRPIELVSPTSAGSGTDIYARALAEIVRREKLLPHTKFLVQRLEEYREFYNEVGATAKPTQ